MQESDLRAALLRQDSPTDIEAELKLLNELVRSERRRAQWLRFWTIAVWVTFFAIMAVLIVVAPFSIASAPVALQDMQPAVQAAPGGPLGPGAFLFLVALLLLELVILPSAGIVLLILMVLSQRSATLTQLRASVATMDAQLKLLAAANVLRSNKVPS